MKERPSPILAPVLLAALAALLQLGPRYWAGVGYILAVCATLPMAVAAALRPCRGPWLFTLAAVLVGMVSQPDLFLFLTLTGPLGLALGMFGHRPTWQGALTGAVFVTAGMFLMPPLAGIYPFSGMELSWTAPRIVLTYGLFGASYAELWRRLFGVVRSRLGLPLRYTKMDHIN